MANSAIKLLLEQALQQEQTALLHFIGAQQELENYYRQLEQIECYRLEYCKQLSQRGQKGLSASSYSHLNRFIVQLDTTLVQQRNAANEFAQNVEDCRAHWQACRQKAHALSWLIEKRQLEQIKHIEIKEQKQMDELALQQFLRKKKN